MPNATTDQLRMLEARCRLLAADLADRGFQEGHDRLIVMADALVTGNLRTAQAGAAPPGMMGNIADAFGGAQPYQIQELADPGSPENPRPTEEEILNQRPAPGSRLDPARGVREETVRKWVVELRDIPAEDEDDLRAKVEPFVNEVGGLLSDYKEEAPRTRQRSGGGGA